MAASVAYGRSQARDPIVAAAAAFAHSLQPHQILNPLGEARDQTCILTETSSEPQPTEPQWVLLYAVVVFVCLFVFCMLFLYRSSGQNSESQMVHPKYGEAEKQETLHRWWEGELSAGLWHLLIKLNVSSMTQTFAFHLKKMYHT